MSTLLSRIDLKSGIFRTQLQAALNGDTTAGRDDVVLGYLSRFEAATTRLRQQFGRRDATLLDVTDVLTAATYLDQYIARNRTTSEASGQWRDLRNDLNTLSTYYRQSWNWNQDLPTGPLAGGTDLRGFASRITGTYRLNTSASDDVSPIVNRALNSVNIGDRENTRLSLERRLRPPEMLAIEMNNRTVSMASSLLPKVTFQADGTARSEANERGRTVTTTATVDEDGLMVTYLGQRSNDFYLTIVPFNWKFDQVFSTCVLLSFDILVIHTATQIPASYSNHSGIASINCDTTSGGVRIAPAMNAPTMT